MRPIGLVGPALLLVGLALLGLALARGEANLYLVLVVPVVTGSGVLLASGILFIFAGFFLTFLFWPVRTIGLPPEVDASQAREVSQVPAPPARRWGGVLFLGPLPVVFGSDPRVTRAMLLVGIALFLALLALTIYALLT